MSNLPIRFSKGFDRLGRSHGSSATPFQPEPTLISSQPQRDMQARTDNLSNLSNQMGRTSVNKENQTQTLVPYNRGEATVQSQGFDHQRAQSSSIRSGFSGKDNNIRFGNRSRHQSSSGRKSDFSHDMGYVGSPTTPGTFKFPPEPGTFNQQYTQVSFYLIRHKYQTLTTTIATYHQ